VVKKSILGKTNRNIPAILDYQKHNHITNRLLHQDYFLQDLANKLYIFHHINIKSNSQDSLYYII
jgi:hypothetical protein